MGKADNYRYPFHLRPKNKQAFQYLRMAGDMVCDMGLDQELAELKRDSNSKMTKEQLDRIRTYVSWFYAASKYVFYWDHIYKEGVNCWQMLASWSPGRRWT